MPSVFSNIIIFSVIQDQDSHDVEYEGDVHGAFEETAPRGREMNNGNNYRFQQNHRNQQQAVAYNKAALAEPMRAGVVQSPYNYPGIHPNYPNQNAVNHETAWQPENYRSA